MEFHRNESHTIKPPMRTQPNIGLDTDARGLVALLLTTTLADEAVLAAKTRAAQWNARGTVFAGQRALFASQVHQLNRMTNGIAERVQVLGGVVMGSFGDFLQHTRLVEHAGSIPDILQILADQEALIRFLREDLRKCVEEYEDAGTASLLVGILVRHEKMAWVLRSDIETKPYASEKTG